MNIDWSGEFGATHCDKQRWCFYKLEGDTWKLHLGNDEWCNSDSLYNGETKVSDLIQRQQPKPWSGPEDGLPPVGTVCEVREPNNYSAFEDWSKCTISAHNIGSNGRPQVCAVDDRGDFAIFYPEIDPVEFRAIPSAADLRETAIRELMDIAQVDCRVTAARLVDAGFKREVV